MGKVAMAYFRRLRAEQVKPTTVLGKACGERCIHTDRYSIPFLARINASWGLAERNIPRLEDEEAGHWEVGHWVSVHERSLPISEHTAVPVEYFIDVVEKGALGLG